jgi:hypothetical protein
MSLSTISGLLLATPFAATLLPLTWELLPLIGALGKQIVVYRAGPITPTTTHQYECELQSLLREFGRVIFQWTVNQVEPEDPNRAPCFASFDNNLYKCRDHSPRRGGIATLFGVISLWRIRYEPCDAGVGLICIFPLEMRLGIVAGKASPALASRLGAWTAQYTQETVRSLLAEEHHVSWSVETIRKVVADLSANLAPLTHAAQVEYLLELLDKAHQSQGPHQPVLCVGRDGIFVPMTKDTKYREAATATVSVLDRKGKRLSTVYLGHMPESGQGTLSQQLTDLLRDVLTGWPGRLPRLQYVTDAGDHPTTYYETVLRPMVHPRTGAPLSWQWVVDYYHACLYVTKMAEALFGKDTKEAASWAAKMRRCLRDKKHGIFRVLHSAAGHAWRLEWLEEDKKAYEAAYAYLSKRIAYMDYSRYRRCGMAIGSGITEAACKTLFTQRFKQSGMKWSWEGGQRVVELRTIWLSGLWQEVYTTYLKQLSQAKMRTKDTITESTHEMAA